MGGRGRLQRVAFWVKSVSQACTIMHRGFEFEGAAFNFQGLALGSLRHSRRGEREGVSGGAVRRIKNVLDTDQGDQGRSAE
jgi:hypothetical protein